MVMPMVVTAGESTQVFDDHLRIQKLFGGFNKSSGLELVGDDALIIQKDDGKVLHIKKSALKKYPVLDVNVYNNHSSGGLLGISSLQQNKTYVFLFYTENPSNDGQKRFEYVMGNKPKQNQQSETNIVNLTAISTSHTGTRDDSTEKRLEYGLGNRVYRYEWNGVELVNPTMILDLPSSPSIDNSGGKVLVGPDMQVFTVIGDLNREGIEQNMAENIADKSLYGNNSGTGGILRITSDGQASAGNPFTEKRLEKFFAYGIRNSFGMTFDPLTGNLWDSEIGPQQMDEINLVKPGFNSGWKQIQGRTTDVCCPSKFSNFKLPQSVSKLYHVSGSHYNEPQVVFPVSTGLTALTFLNSEKLGKEYQYDLFVGDMSGNIYNFDLDKSRENIVLKENLSEHIFASGFGAISDLKMSHDGNLYVLTFSNNTGYDFAEKSGSLYVIKQNSISDSLEVPSIDFWVTVILVLLIGGISTYAGLYARKVRD